MTQAGIGALLHYLSGRSPRDPDEFVGRVIAGASLEEDALRLTFADGTRIKIWDNGQSSCESRYMRSDDDVQSLVGKKLVMIEAREAPEIQDGVECHEVCFLEVRTDSGFVTIANHNEHNGYYGGFGLSIDVEAGGPS